MAQKSRKAFFVAISIAAFTCSCGSDEGTAGRTHDGGGGKSGSTGDAGGQSGNGGQGGRAGSGGSAGVGGNAGRAGADGSVAPSDGGQDGPSTGPVVTITSHQDNARIIGSRNVTLSGTLSDTRLITSFAVKLNGGGGASSTFGQTSFSAQLALANRTNTIEVVATDAAGLTGTDTIHLDYPFVAITTFQAAGVVIGQPNLSSQQQNRGGLAKANTIFWPFGSPTFSNGGLFLPDSANNRVLGSRATGFRHVRRPRHS